MALRTIALSAWATQQGVSRMTAWRMATAGSIEGARTSPAGRWVVDVEDPEPPMLTAAYACVSSHDQKWTKKPQRW